MKDFQLGQEKVSERLSKQPQELLMKQLVIEKITSKNSSS
jgi:hypothetical protein